MSGSVRRSIGVLFPALLALLIVSAPVYAQGAARRGRQSSGQSTQQLTNLQSALQNANQQLTTLYWFVVAATSICTW